MSSSKINNWINNWQDQAKITKKYIKIHTSFNYILKYGIT